MGLNLVDAGGVGGRGTFGASGRPPERPWFLLVPVSPVYSLFHPDQGVKRESWGWWWAEFFTFKSLSSSCEWMEMDFDLVGGKVAWRLSVWVQ